MKVLSREYRPGGAANVAANIVSLGGEITLIGVGNAPYILEKTELGFRPTTRKTRYVVGWQQVARCDEEVTYPIKRETETVVVYETLRALANASVLVISDYQKGVIHSHNMILTLIGEALRKNVTVIVDSKSNDWSKFVGATLITPNETEWHRARRTLPDNTHVLLTLGDRGMELDRVPIPAVSGHSVADVTGAGDTVVAAMAVWMAEHGTSNLLEGVRFANKAAGVVVGKRGTSTVTRAEIE
jgi:D-beta-D-heptose 7-phosphate kinase/D-beta-D-heptose 1-phosphate adenosyltransferase